MALPNPKQTEFYIHQRLDSCDSHSSISETTTKGNDVDSQKPSGWYQNGTRHSRWKQPINVSQSILKLGDLASYFLFFTDREAAWSSRTVSRKKKTVNFAFLDIGTLVIGVFLVRLSHIKNYLNLIIHFFLISILKKKSKIIYF